MNKIYLNIDDDSKLAIVDDYNSDHYAINHTNLISEEVFSDSEGEGKFGLPKIFELQKDFQGDPPWQDQLRNGSGRPLAECVINLANTRQSERPSSNQCFDQHHRSFQERNSSVKTKNSISIDKRQCRKKKNILGNLIVKNQQTFLRKEWPKSLVD